MKVAIYSNDLEKSSQVAKQLKALIDKSRYLELDNKDPEIVISVGGDGTLLSAFHHYINKLDKVRFVGIRTGHLGFYTDWLSDQAPELIKSLEHDQGDSVSYPLLSVTVSYTNTNETDHFLCLNESTLKKINETLVAKIYINKELFEVFRGDGICVSTPTGSTAYNKSLGGAVLSPNFNAIQLTEIASLNNTVFRTVGSPLIIPPTDIITIIPNVAVHTTLTCDNLAIVDKPIKSVSYHTSQKRICFEKYRHSNFWKRVSKNFIDDNSNQGTDNDKV